MAHPQIVWLRRDLRLVDQPAFCAAASAGPVIPVFVLDDERPGARRLGEASRWWLHGSLSALDRELRDAGARLILRRGDVVQALRTVAKESGASTIHALRHYEPWWREAEDELGQYLNLCLYDGNYLLSPGSVVTAAGTPYKIFTPFYRAALRSVPQRHALDPPELSTPSGWLGSETLDGWDLLPSKPDWAGGLREAWQPGTSSARLLLQDFVERVEAYRSDRNIPSRDGTSRLSPYLHWGELSPQMVWDAIERASGSGAETYRAELLWRDYAQNVICQCSDYPERSYRSEFQRLAWRDPAQDPAAAMDLEAWQQGRTGYPIVDAGMRQLWTTGWMHNRVRMIAASFLIKHLLIDWRHGERWFWDTLVDADYANNGVNWQWVAGTGLDSSQFTRIMAPLAQSAKFDASAYIRTWVPELAELDDADVHDPPVELRPQGYRRVIGHAEARARALGAYRRMKEG